MSLSDPSSTPSAPRIAAARSAPATAPSASAPTISRKVASPTTASASPRTSCLTCSKVPPRSTRSSMRSSPTIRRASSLRCRRRPMPDASGLTFAKAFAKTAGVLRQAGIGSPELDARLLLCHAAGLTHEATIARAHGDLGRAAAARLEALIARRLEREPVSRILGLREFYGRAFLVDRHTLDPRPDTESLIEAALDLVDKGGLRNQPLKLLDLGTGTGCILITLLAELPEAHGLGTDISGAALE